VIEYSMLSIYVICCCMLIIKDVVMDVMCLIRFYCIGLVCVMLDYCINCAMKTIHTYVQIKLAVV